MVTTNSRVWFKAGETIMRQGEPGNSAYIIESGRVEILFEKPDGRMQCVGTRGSDTMIGEMALVDDAPRTATVRAIEDCTLLELSKEDFSGRLRQADPVLRMTAQVILNRYRDMLSRAEITGPEPAVPAEAIEVSNAERQQVIECVRLNNEFRQALQGGELELYYQPVVSLQTGEIRGFEALMRWQHPVRGFIAPALFIPMAENSGLIVEASAWALREACAALKRVEKATGRKDLFVSVNLSTMDFIAPGIVNRVFESLHASGLEPHRLHLEITERLLMHQPERARAILEEFHSIGVQISIDDFGTGYSSLSYLHSFPIDVLKIDRSFVTAMRKDTRSHELVRAIVSLGRNLGIKVIAEGVEESAEALALANLACDEGQGYHFARPLTEDRLAALVAVGPLPVLPATFADDARLPRVIYA
jgi:EAL domain-containing protein (putative c-di-GMP-specific phosphodiesterase class I)